MLGVQPRVRTSVHPTKRSLITRSKGFTRYHVYPAFRPFEIFFIPGCFYSFLKLCFFFIFAQTSLPAFLLQRDICFATPFCKRHRIFVARRYMLRNPFLQTSSYFCRKPPWCLQPITIFSHVSMTQHFIKYRSQNHKPSQSDYIQYPIDLRYQRFPHCI